MRPSANALPGSKRHPSRRELPRGPSRHGFVETSSQYRQWETLEVQQRAANVVPYSRLGLPSCRALSSNPFAIAPKNPENRSMPHNASASRIVRYPTRVCVSVGQALAPSARQPQVYCLKRHIDWDNHRDQRLRPPAMTCTPTQQRTRRLSRSSGRAFVAPEPTDASPLDRREVQPHSGASAREHKGYVRVHERTFQFNLRQSPSAALRGSLAPCNPNNASALCRAPLRPYSRDRYHQHRSHILRLPTPQNLTAQRPRCDATRTRGPP
jgi:hypothetical protein